MKTTKKLAAMFLAMVMALSLTAMTAAAYGETGHAHDEACCEETIQPRKPSGPCPKCGQGAVYVDYGTATDHTGKVYHIYVYECGTCGTFEWHVW